MPQLSLPVCPSLTRFLVVATAGVVAATILVAGSTSDASAAQKCIKIGQKTLCFDNGKGQKQNGGDNAGNQNGGGGADQSNGGGGGDQGGGGGGQGGGNDDTPTPQSKPLDCSKAQCDAGEVKLDKPSKYGACCTPAEGLCPADRPVGTPPNCCAHGTVFREGGCYPETCGPGTVGTPPHCDRVCAPGKVKVDQSCYDPCPAGTLGTPPNCRCPSGQIWDKDANACKGCPAGMVGTPPNCQCPAKTILVDGTCQKCTGGRVVKDGQCKCPNGTGEHEGECRKCWGGRESVNGQCKCPVGKMAFPNATSNCVNGTQIKCVWRGTAPFCDGECLPGEQANGGGDTRNSNTAPVEYRALFGKPCTSGGKMLCCRPQ